MAANVTFERGDEMPRILLVAALYICVTAHSMRSSAQEAAPPTGIASVSRGKLVLTIPPDRPSHGSLRYSLAFPFQTGPRTAGLMVLRMTEETRNYGFLDGSDIVLLDELNPPRPEQIFAANRTEVVKGPPGASPRLFLKSPLGGGFVPCRALRADGTAHPHAGTGFGLGPAHWFTFSDDRFSWGDPNRKDMNEIYQLAYDGKRFTSRLSGVWDQNGKDRLLIGDTGWSILTYGLSNAIPDGDDLLLPIVAARLDETALATGIIRWVRRNSAWQPVGFDPVAIDKRPVPKGPNPGERVAWAEPSLARAGDGSLLFSVRGADTFGKKGHDASGYRVQVWRSAEAGKWDLVLDIPKTRLNSPVTVNAAADGSAYLVSNPYNPMFIPETSHTGRGREKLVLWPLTKDCTGLQSPIVIQDCLANFGKPPGSDKGAEKWMADHPNGMTVRLKDGRWHHLLVYRVCHSPRYQPSLSAPSSHSGCYIEEVISQGPARPQWRFADGD